MPKYVNIKVDEIVDIIPVSIKVNSVSILKKGKYPVYSSETSNCGIKGYTNNPNFNQNNEIYIVFGDHTRSINIVHCPFSVMDNVKVLKIKKGLNIDELYLKYVWQNLIPNLGYSRHWKVAKNIAISIPLNDNNNYDIEKQKEIAKKYKELEKKKQILLNKISLLEDLKIEIVEKQVEMVDLAFNNMFKLERGYIISKSHISNNQGFFPVYSTQKEVFGYINSFMKDGKYLLWNTDGLAGYIKITDGKFSYTNIVGIMIPTNKYDMSLLSYEYLKCYLEPIFRKHRKGRMGINGKNEYTKLNSTMIKNLNIKIPIPRKEDGNFDLEKQKEIAQKFTMIENIKNDLYKKVIDLVNIKIV